MVKKDPFETKEIVEVYYNQVDGNGNVGKYKVESGVPVKVADLGSIKDYFNRAIQRAALMTPKQVEELDFSNMPHVEAAAIKMAAYAAAGDLKAMQEIYDRVMGRAKQVSESTHLNLTIDDVLNPVKTRGDVVDVN